MVCKHQLALCKLHDCKACDFQGDEAKCPFAYSESMSDTNPTFRQMLEIYKTVKSSRMHKAQVARLIESDIARVGLSLDSKSAEMTRTKFKTLLMLLQAPQPNGKMLSGETIKNHIAAFRSISSEWLDDKFMDKGFDLPAFSIPRFKCSRRPVQEISDRTIRKVEIEMEKWLASGTPSNRDAYIFCFLPFTVVCEQEIFVLSNGTVFSKHQLV